MLRLKNQRTPLRASRPVIFAPARMCALLLLPVWSSTASAADANSDLDQDGITARNEYLNGTNPNDAQNIPESDILLSPAKRAFCNCDMGAEDQTLQGTSKNCLFSR